MENFYWLNEKATTFLKRGYLAEGETPLSRIRDIADHAERILNIKGFSDKFYEFMGKGFYSLSSPVWSNFGREKGLAISCYGSTCDDTLDSILNVGRELGMMSKYGGGTSLYLGNIRPRGSSISSGGVADGPVHYAHIYDTIIDKCSQGGVRRGACALYLDIDHPDVEEFLKIGTEGNPIQNLQYGVCVSDEFMREMVGGDSAKRNIWAKVIKARVDTGFPYIFFSDTVNNNSPYNDLGKKILASNLCLTGDQRVVTSKGYLTVRELYESAEELELFDGEKMVKSSPMLLRDLDSEVLKITYSNGMTQKVSPNHGIPVLNDTRGDIVRVEAKDLKIGDNVAAQTKRGIFGTLEATEQAVEDGKRGVRVPSYIFSSTEDTVLDYLWQLTESDTYTKVSNLFKGDYEFLSDLQILLSNLEFYSVLEQSKENGGYTLTIIKGLPPKTLKVVSIEKVDNEPVYCPTVYTDEHIFVSNGLKTFNCSEIALPSSMDESFVCCLGSLNLLHWDEIEKTDAVEVYIQFLNAVMDDFIEKSYKLPGMGRAHRFARNNRALGLGVLGYHSYLQKKLIPFESLQAKSANERIFKTIKERSDAESQRLCKELGIKSVREGYANATLIAIAPTKSSSYILGQVSMGIEPIKSNYFVKDLAKIKDVYKNPFLVEELEKYGLNTPDVWEDILAKDGSVQHLDFPTKEVFKSFIEISPKEIILQAAQRQKYIDQSQSLNLMIHASIPAKEINKLLIYAWESGVKTLYYNFSQSAAQSYSREINECVSCEG
jgi:ribonucleotide reductase alpha subunit